MKFLLTPLVVAGMFLSFSAAMVAMLFYTDTVDSAQELVSMLTQEHDPSELPERLVDHEDKLTTMLATVEDYRLQYEAQLESLTTEREVLTLTTAQVVQSRQSLQQELANQRMATDSMSAQRALRQVATLAPAFSKIKPDDAAAILAEGSLSDTLVAHLMSELEPQQVARIMGSLDVAYAAQITQLMGELTP